VGTGSINPSTGTEEFGVGDWLESAANKVRGLFGNDDEIEPITVTATRRRERLDASDEGEEVPGTKFSRMIPTETGAEGRMFNDEQVEHDKIDLYGPIPHVNRLAKSDIPNMTDAELAEFQQSLEGWAAFKSGAGIGIGYIPHKAATAISQGLGVWAGSDLARAGETQRELDWRKYIRSHR
jgi:hypothetical protein